MRASHKADSPAELARLRDSSESAAIWTSVIRELFPHPIRLTLPSDCRSPLIFYRPWLDAITKGMIAKGVDAYTATAQAMRVLDAMISRQVSVLAYNHVFVLVSSHFFIGFPLVFLLRRGSPDGEVEIALDWGPNSWGI